MKRKAYSMTAEEIVAATAALNNQRGSMRFLLPVDPQLRARTRRLSAAASQMAEKRLAAAREHVGDLPTNFDLRNFERNVALMKALQACRDAAARIQAELQDTLNRVGNDASLAGVEAYAHLKASYVASPGLNRTVGGLATRRPRSGKSATPAPEAVPAPPQPVAAPTTAAPAAPTGATATTAGVPTVAPAPGGRDRNAA